MALEVGAVAPEFALLATPDQRVSRSEFHGPVVLIFYPADWSPVCSDEPRSSARRAGCSRAIRLDE